MDIGYERFTSFKFHRANKVKYPNRPQDLYQHSSL